MEGAVTEERWSECVMDYRDVRRIDVPAGHSSG